MIVAICCFLWPHSGLSQEPAAPPSGQTQPAESLATQTGQPQQQSPPQEGQTAQASQPAQEQLQQRIGRGASWGFSFGKIFWTIVLVLATILFLKYFTRLMEAISERWTNLRITIKSIIPVIRISSWTLIIYIIIAEVFAPPIETLLAVTASAGIAIGFASQDILKNIFGGIMILLDRPFKVGDKIEIGGHYGEVIRIGLRTVRIVTPDDSLVSIPNSDIVSQSVSNANAGESNCQVVAEFYLPAHVDLSKVRQVAYRAAAISRYVYLNKPIAIIFKNEAHGRRSLVKMRLKAYVLDIRYEFVFATEMTEIVMTELLTKGMVKPEEMAALPYL